jgi:hypothetical protein
MTATSSKGITYALEKGHCYLTFLLINLCFIAIWIFKTTMWNREQLQYLPVLIFYNFIKSSLGSSVVVMSHN